MKKLGIITLSVIFTIGMCSVVISQTVVASKHDLSTGGGITDKSTNEDRVCIFCHTPHQPSAASATDPLWNHTLSSTAAFGVYASDTFDADSEVVLDSYAGDIADIAGTGTASELCMSCHDGTVAVNSLYNPSNEFGTPTMGSGNELDATGKITSSANMGTSLSDDHPVNFTFDNGLYTSDGGLKDPSGASIQALLISNKVQCSSCHDVHDPTNSPFLVMDNSASALCITCHDK